MSPAAYSRLAISGQYQLAAVFGIFIIYALYQLGSIWPSAGHEKSKVLDIVASSGTRPLLEALSERYVQYRPDLEINVRTGPISVTRGLDMVTLLEGQEGIDLLSYHGGALAQQLDPSVFMADLTSLPSQSRVDPEFQKTVTFDGRILGVPLGPAVGGGIFYNRELYDRLGLQVPATWQEFIANNRVIVEAGLIPVMQTYGETWTSQLMMLADHFNVDQADPKFINRLNAGEAGYSDTPAALRSFEKIEELAKNGLMNNSRATALPKEGFAALLAGEAGHYPMLSAQVSQLIDQAAREDIAEIGFFAVPGDSLAPAGMTVWLPMALYAAKTSDQLDDALDFIEFVLSEEGCAVQEDFLGGIGIYLVDGCPAPRADMPALQDMQRYFKSPDLNSPAMEFLSPLKGPSLEQITMAVGLGMLSAKEAARRYDQDIAFVAGKLGMPSIEKPAHR